MEVCSVHKDQTKQKQTTKNFQFPDKSNSPTTHRTVSMSDIRMPRVTSNGGGSNSGQQQQTLSPTTQQSQTQQNATGSGGDGGSGTAAVVSGVVGGSVGGGNNSQTTNTNNGANNGSNSTIVTIKQESLGNVDNLVGSYVDSTTFLHSPGSQMVNPNLVQNNSGLSGIGAGENEITIFFKKRKENF